MNEIYAAFGAFAFVNFLKVHKISPKFNRKPLSCSLCMAGWFALILNFGGYWLHVPFQMAMAMVYAFFLTSFVNWISLKVPVKI